MDYKRVHDSIINRAKSRTIDGYCESHHIVPRCIGGTNLPDNLVDLSAREHFIVHLLLTKIHPNQPKLIYAAAMMSVGSSKHTRSSNRLYESLKIKRSKLMSELHTGKIISEETRQKLREKNKHYNPTAEAKERQRQAQIGKRHSEKSKRKMSEAKKGKTSPTKGTRLSTETKQKISKANKCKVISLEQKEHLSRINTGKKLSKETCDKMSSSRKGRPLSDSHKTSLSIAMKGKVSQYIWITNGIENKRVHISSHIPNEWHRGRTNPKRKNTPCVSGH